jgi:hypothetical protein
MILGVTAETRTNRRPHPSTSLVAFHSSTFHNTHVLSYRLNGRSVNLTTPSSPRSKLDHYLHSLIRLHGMALRRRGQTAFSFNIQILHSRCPTSAM